MRQFGDVVANEPLLRDSPKLEALRKRLLKEPLDYFRALRDRLRADRDTRPESLDRLATAGFNLGKLTNEIGEKEAAFAHYRECVAIRQKLADDHPSITRYESDLAITQRNLGLLLLETGQATEAARSVRGGTDDPAEAGGCSPHQQEVPIRPRGHVQQP